MLAIANATLFYLAVGMHLCSRMTSAVADASAAGSTPAKVGLMSILIPVLLSTVLTLGVVGGGGFWLVKSGRLAAHAGAAAAEIPTPSTELAQSPSHVLALEPMVVNLADAGGRSYLRAAVSLRIRDEELPAKKKEAPVDPKAIDGAAAALRDTTLIVLSRETADTLLEPDGRELLKKKLDEQYKLHNMETRVLEIYFTDFLVQRG